MNKFKMSCLGALKKDYIRSDKNKIVLLILCIYRVGNYIYYSEFNNIIKKIILFFLKITQLLLVRIPFGVDIPFEARIEEGIRLVHPNGCFINKDVVIGKNCTIYQQVTIGASTGNSIKTPIIGENVYLGAGAKVIGGVIIENNVKIGANAVVVKSVKEGSIVVCRQEVLIK